MTHNLIIVVSAIILSYVFIGFAGRFIASSEDMQLFMDVYYDHSKGILIEDKRAEVVFSRLERGKIFSIWLYIPQLYF